MTYLFTSFFSRAQLQLSSTNSASLDDRVIFLTIIYQRVNRLILVDNELLNFTKCANLSHDLFIVFLKAKEVLLFFLCEVIILEESQIIVVLLLVGISGVTKEYKSTAQCRSHVLFLLFGITVCLIEKLCVVGLE